MKLLKKIVMGLIAMTLVFLVFLFWYQQRYSMDVVEAFEINDPGLERRLLIATQGSDFKNAITDTITDHFTNDSLYVKVIDISFLRTTDPSDFNAILVLHTWENWKPPLAVDSFVARIGKQKRKLIMMTTSGEGSYKMAGVDAFAGESVMAHVPIFSDSIINRLEVLLKSNY